MLWALVLPYWSRQLPLELQLVGELLPQQVALLLSQLDERGIRMLWGWAEPLLPQLVLVDTPNKETGRQQLLPELPSDKVVVGQRWPRLPEHPRRDSLQQSGKN